MASNGEDDLFSDDECPGCGRRVPLWRLYPFHEPNGTIFRNRRPPWPYLYDQKEDGFTIACEWDRDALTERFNRRHEVSHDLDRHAHTDVAPDRAGP